MSIELKEILKNNAFKLGADIFGIADLALFKKENSPVTPTNLTDGFTKAVSVAIALPKGIFKKIDTAPTPEYAKFYSTLNEHLDNIAFYLAKTIEEKGFIALPIPASQKLGDSENFTGAITHKAVARLAGIGWQGKSLLIVSPEYGPRIRLVTVLTNADLESDTPMDNMCGTCQDCTNACPSSAIKGVLPKGEFYETREEALFFNRCKEKLTKEFAKLPDINYPICGFCIKACPFAKVL